MRTIALALLILSVLLQTSCTNWSSAEEPMHVFLLIGQSNMVGRAKLQQGDDKIIKDCFLWNGKNWEPAKPGFNRYSKHIKPDSTQGMNCGPSFVEAYQQANPGVKVGIICWSRGGTKIEEWHPSHLKPWDLYREAVTQTHRALKAEGQLKGILWHQGEANFRKTREYPSLLKEHIQRLRLEFQEPDLPFVFSQIGQWRDDYKPFNEMIIKQPALINRTACIRTDGLTNFDPYHFDHKSQQIMGRLYAREMIRLMNNK